MKYVDIVPLMEIGKKFKRKPWGDQYLDITEFVFPHMRSPKTILTLHINGEAHFNFSLTSEDLTMDDWGECNEIIPVKMVAKSFSVTCPKCGNVYWLGNSWDAHVGDLTACTCGANILAMPPECVKEPQPAQTVKKVSPWPEA